MQLWILGLFFSTLPPCLSSLASLLNRRLWEEGYSLYPNLLWNMLGDGSAEVLEMGVGGEQGQRKVDDVIFQIP